jgi:site-specific DNA recombinase
VGKWPPIVDRARWEQLQALLAQRGASSKTPKRRSILTGLLICGECSTTMVRTADHARPVKGDGLYRKVWRCPTYTRKDAVTPSCGRVTIDAAGVEGLLVARTLDKASTLDLAAVVEAHDGCGREAAELVEQLADLDRRAAEVAASFGKPGGITLLVLESTSVAIERERATVQKRLAELAGGALLAPYVSQPNSLREAWERRLTVDQKRELIRVLVGRVRILPARPGLPRFDPDRVVWLRE